MVTLSSWFVILLIHILFSTTFITTFIIGLVINSQIRQYTLICITWCLWLFGTLLFSFGRIVVGAYHTSRISLNIIFFTVSSLLLRISLLARSYITDKDNLYYQLEGAKTYDEWYKIGNKLDYLCGGNEWREIEETDEYQWIYVKDYIFRLQRARNENDIKQIMFLLRWCCHRNFASISNPVLYDKAFCGTKILIEKFETEIIDILEFLSSVAIQDSNKLEFQNSRELLGNETDQEIKEVNNISEKYRKSMKQCFTESAEFEVDGVDNIIVENRCNLTVTSSSTSSEFNKDEISQQLMTSFCFNKNENKEINPIIMEDNNNYYMKYKTSDSVLKDLDVKNEIDRTSFKEEDGGINLKYNSKTNMTTQSRRTSVTDSSSESMPILASSSTNLSLSSFSEFRSIKKDVSVQTCEYFLGIEINKMTMGSANSYLSIISPQNTTQCICKNMSINLDIAKSYIQKVGIMLNSPLKYPSWSLYRNMSARPLICEMLTEMSGIVHDRDGILQFLELLGHSIGRTALCLSGGGALAMYHLGVVKVLIQQNIMPNIINGTSGGSIVAAILAITNNDEILKNYIQPTVSNMYGHRWFPPFSVQIRHFLVKGYMVNPKEFTKTCQMYFKNYTFLEAYKLTGRIVTITISPTHNNTELIEPLVLNCITTPDVLLWSAVVASCSLPGLMPVTELYAKDNHTNRTIRYFPPGMKWMDGSINQDVPHKELSTLFNVRQFIVSQVNPHHVPFVQIHNKNKAILYSERKFLYNILNWLTLDIKYRYIKLAKLKLIPKLFGKDVSNFWMLQDVEGHVTITPRVSLFDWYRCVNHPSYDDMLHFINEGERRTWPHVMRIKHMSLLENAVKESIKKIKQGIII
ncbi:patatin-like phospholipase family protein [Cryptosporidium muris RN66]|uniref:Patatin-like phospholipase family protein n=1 Tax=Cryptosporidium muris (strain RN66) TaxID=441375 RepID=B6AJR9_CRYMR|nr:patatin-like phospholipase family protein [Cryptosporidium muris RN66]EEA08460.1 patatin-like phospholipase family protein [Cryptosporidium muris RN66]|eukprot:XP_002142809.1 patatin-like phospholipase family protein [Cryptosporidium muris RN66]